MAQTNPYSILRVDDVPEHYSLHQLLYKMFLYTRRIVGIYRTADYNARRLGRTVYFICTSRQEADHAASLMLNLERDVLREVHIVPSVVGRAALPDVRLENLYQGKPIPIHMTGLLRHTDAEGITDYLASLVTYFETRGTMTSFRLNYDMPRGITRSDGFCSYLGESDAREIAGEVHPKFHSFHGQRIKAVLSYNIPLLVRESDSYLLNKGRVEWSSRLIPYNQLMIKLEQPFVHARKDAVSVPSKVPSVSSIQSDVSMSRVLHPRITPPSESVQMLVVAKPSTSRQVVVSNKGESSSNRPYVTISESSSEESLVRRDKPSHNSRSVYSSSQSREGTSSQSSRYETASASSLSKSPVQPQQAVPVQKRRLASVIVKPAERQVSIRKGSNKSVSKSTASARGGGSQQSANSSQSKSGGPSTESGHSSSSHKSSKPFQKRKSNQDVSFAAGALCARCSMPIQSASGHLKCNKRTQTDLSPVNPQEDGSESDNLSITAVHDEKDATTGPFPIQFSVEDAPLVLNRIYPRAITPEPGVSLKYARQNADASPISDWSSDEERLVIDTNVRLSEEDGSSPGF